MKNPILPKYTEIKINSKDKKFWFQANIEQVRRLSTKIQCEKKIHECNKELFSRVKTQDFQ